MSKRTEMDKTAAARIQSAADRNPQSPTGRSGFAPRAQSRADRRQDNLDDPYVDEEE